MIFMKEAASDRSGNSNKHFDLTEESSKRKGGEEATSVARQLENDDVSKNIGSVNSANDKDVENEVWTSSSDE